MAQLSSNVPDTYSAITQLIAAQHEVMSLSGTSALQYPTTPPTSLISDDENDEMLTPINGNPAQFSPYTPHRLVTLNQLNQQTIPIPDTPESPTPENRGQSDDFYPDNIPLDNPPPNIVAVADELRNLTLQPHPQRNEWTTGCLVCGKSYDQVLEETVADYINQTARPGETVRERQIKRNAFIDGVQSGVFTFIPRECRRLPPVMAWSTPSIKMRRTQSHRAMLCPYLKTDIIELLLNKSPD